MNCMQATCRQTGPEHQISSLWVLLPHTLWWRWQIWARTIKSMLLSSLRKYSMSFSKRFFSLLTCQTIKTCWCAFKQLPKPGVHAHFLLKAVEYCPTLIAKHLTQSYMYDRYACYKYDYSAWEGGRCHSQDEWWKRGSLQGLLTKSCCHRNIHLLEVVKSRKNDVVSSSDETHGGQQLQHESFGPATVEDGGGGLDVDTNSFISHTQTHSPGIPAVEAEGDLVHTARVSHHQIKSRLKAKQDSNKRTGGIKCIKKFFTSSHINHIYSKEKAGIWSTWGQIDLLCQLFSVTDLLVWKRSTW